MVVGVFGRNMGPIESIVDEALGCLCLGFKVVGLLIFVLSYPIIRYGVFNFVFPILISCYFVTLDVLIAEVILVAIFIVGVVVMIMGHVEAEINVL